MMQFSELESHEPAFIKHEKFIRTNRPRGAPKKCNDCCYSIANLALIVACILGLVFCIKFFLDEPLYDYGEYLLQLRFYRQLIFVIVTLPMVLLLPLFNASAVFYFMSSSSSPKPELGTSVLYVKLIYQILLVALVVVALVFVAPYMRYEGVYSQIDLELKKFMSRRYQDDFYLNSMDDLQKEYHCCDVPFYRSLFIEQTLPWTCFASDGSTRFPYSRSCSQILAGLVSDRCLVLAACLLIILLALAALLGIDIIELVCRSSGGRHYDVRACESELTAHSDPEERTRLASSSPHSHQEVDREAGNQSKAESDHFDLSDNSDDDGSNQNDGANLNRQAQSIHDELVEELNSKLKDRAGQQDTSQLLYKSQPSVADPRRSPIRACRLEDLEDWPSLGHAEPSSVASQNHAPQPILTRANYLPSTYASRPRSPLFLVRAEHSPVRAEISTTSSQVTTRSVLKKSTSITRVDDSDLSEDDNDDNVKRDTPTRRSMLNVRFDC